VKQSSKYYAVLKISIIPWPIKPPFLPGLSAQRGRKREREREREREKR